MITIKPELYAPIKIKKQEIIKTGVHDGENTLLQVKTVILFEGRQLTATTSLRQKEISNIPQILSGHIKSSALLYKHSDIDSFAQTISRAK